MPALSSMLARGSETRPAPLLPALTLPGCPGVGGPPHSFPDQPFPTVPIETLVPVVKVLGKQPTELGRGAFRLGGSPTPARPSGGASPTAGSPPDAPFTALRLRCVPGICSPAALMLNRKPWDFIARRLCLRLLPAHRTAQVPLSSSRRLAFPWPPTRRLGLAGGLARASEQRIPPGLSGERPEPGSPRPRPPCPRGAATARRKPLLLPLQKAPAAAACHSVPKLLPAAQGVSRFRIATHSQTPKASPPQPSGGLQEAPLAWPYPVFTFCLPFKTGSLSVGRSRRGSDVTGLPPTPARIGDNRSGDSESQRN